MGMIQHTAVYPLPAAASEEHPACCCRAPELWDLETGESQFSGERGLNVFLAGHNGPFVP